MPGESKAMVEFDSWIICPKCHNAMVGEVGEECFLCGVECVATPLYPDVPQDIEPRSSRIVKGIQKARATQAREAQAICAEFGVEYTPEEREVLDEFGL